MSKATEPVKTKHQITLPSRAYSGFRRTAMTTHNAYIRELRALALTVYETARQDGMTYREYGWQAYIQRQLSSMQVSEALKTDIINIWMTGHGKIDKPGVKTIPEMLVSRGGSILLSGATLLFDDALRLMRLVPKGKNLNVIVKHPTMQRVLQLLGEVVWTKGTGGNFLRQKYPTDKSEDELEPEIEVAAEVEPESAAESVSEIKNLYYIRKVTPTHVEYWRTRGAGLTEDIREAGAYTEYMLEDIDAAELGQYSAIAVDEAKAEARQAAGGAVYVIRSNDNDLPYYYLAPDMGTTREFHQAHRFTKEEAIAACRTYGLGRDCTYELVCAITNDVEIITI